LIVGPGVFDAVGIGDGVCVIVGVRVGVAVAVLVGVRVGVAVDGIGVGVRVGVLVAVALGVVVRVAVGVGDGGVNAPQAEPSSAITSKNRRKCIVNIRHCPVQPHSIPRAQQIIHEKCAGVG
jgi:hypothetical protein